MLAFERFATKKGEVPAVPVAATATRFRLFRI
jgi:hypothetical protein